MEKIIASQHRTRPCIANRLVNRFIVALFFFVTSINCAPAQTDSLRLIQEITIDGDWRQNETLKPQTIGHAQLSRISAHNVADAVRWMSGVQVKDYGGIGGLKTINLRSMGSHHVGIYYDGMEMGNAQNGVVDLGQLSLDNVAEVSVYHGQRASMLQTAREYSNSGTVFIQTINPLKSALRPARIKATMSYGSFDTGRASVLWTHYINNNIACTVNAEGLTSSGKYRFDYRRRNLDGSLAYDTTAIRQNGDVENLRLEANLYGHHSRRDWSAKTWWMTSRRGIPGAIVNNVWRRGERQHDQTLAAQGSYHQLLGHSRSLKVQAKYGNYRTHYVSRDTTQLMIDNTYRQQNLLLSAVLTHELGTRLWDAWSLDVGMDWMTGDRKTLRHDPLRVRTDLAKAIGYENRGLRINLSLAMTNITDWLEGDSTVSRCYWSPSLTLSYDWQPWLTLKSYAKRGMRMPTFNDLYYTDMGNANLRPEKSSQLAVGLETRHSNNTRWKVTASLDGYYNHIRDKIIAYPRGQQFRWTMLNLGRVDIYGLELRATGQYQLTGDWCAEAMLQYTWQSARDVTDPSTAYYRHQIPYIPQHNGSVMAMCRWREWSVGYNFVYTGERYSQQENIRYNHLEPWYTSDLTLSGKWGKWRMVMEVKNLLNQQYDVVINYPMPGRNYNMTLQCEL